MKITSALAKIYRSVMTRRRSTRVRQPRTGHRVSQALFRCLPRCAQCLQSSVITPQLLPFLLPLPQHKGSLKSTLSQAGALGHQPTIFSAYWISESSRFPCPNSLSLGLLACHMVSGTNLDLVAAGWGLAKVKSFVGNSILKNQCFHYCLRCLSLWVVYCCWNKLLRQTQYLKTMHI